MTSNPNAPFDFFANGELPAPRVTASQAERIAAEHFAVTASAESLGSQQDANFLLRMDDGTIAAVLKIANPVFGTAEVEAQDLAAETIATACPDLRLATRLGDPAVVITDQGPAVARLLRYLPGGTLSGPRHLSPRTVASMGTVAGRVSRALRDFRHEGLDRVLQWDLWHADRLIETLLPHVSDPGERTAVQTATAEALAEIDRLADGLPRQAVHLDLTDDNLVRSPADPLLMADGVIDLGDLTDTWAVSELAITLSSLLHHDGNQPHDVLPAVRAFHAVRPLAAPEVAALWPLVVLRAAGLVVSGRQQATVDGDNAYVLSGIDREWRIFERATSVPCAVMTGLVEAALGLSRNPLSLPPFSVRLLAADPVVVDLGPDADAVDRGAWLEPGIGDRLAAALISEGAPVVAARYAQPRLAGVPALSSTAPATVPTGVDLWLRDSAALRAPADGTILDISATRVAIAYGAYTLALSFTDSVPAMAIGDQARAGDELVVLPAGARLRVSVQLADVPAFVRPEYAAGWLALTVDPGPLVGLGAVPGVREKLLERRDAVFATVQEHYYADPPRIERGWRHYLVSDGARSYLDMVNNVTPLGHAHPRVEEAVTRQLRRLNTNSRFHYASIVEYAERLTALLPGPLDTVFLVNSGSEAADLAIRLATGATGREDVVAVREAYHGWTYASDAVSTSTHDNPKALATRPSWVHTVDSPNPYRGRHRGAEAVRYAPEAVAVLDDLAASGRPPAAFMGETVYGNAGGMTLPDGYLEQVYAAVRAHGGLAIADEVQVGYGRLGHWFWGFEQQGVVPDIVCVAKAIGNGHPVGAVITSRAIADRYHDQGSFFSSTGGSPVASVVGITVLDALRDEDLQANAARVGDHLKARLAALGDHFPIVGTVHGHGLYLGLELVRDRATLEPATEETAELCDRLLGLGVILQPTGDHFNILKIKPPLCIDLTAADFFADAVATALTELGHALPVGRSAV